MNFKELATPLRAAGDAAAVGAALLPEPAATVARTVGVALRFAAAIAEQGKDPVAHLTRIHVADPLLAEVDQEWKDAMRAKFGPRP